MSGGIGSTRFWVFMLFGGAVFFLCGSILLHFWLAAAFGWIFIGLLWLQFYVSTFFKTRLQRSAKALILLPLALAIAGHYCFNLLSLPTYFAHSLVATWIIIQILILYFANRSPYFLWRLQPDSAYFSSFEWLYNDKVSTKKWIVLVQKWQAKKANEDINSFFIELLSVITNRQENETQLLELLVAVFPFWPPDLIQNIDESPISQDMAFKIISHDKTRQIFVAHLFANPDFAPQWSAIFALCNQHIDAFVEEPSVYGFDVAYFLQENILEKVEQALEVEADKFAAFPDIQAQWQYFYGLHYMAIGIAQNLPTYDDYEFNSDDLAQYDDDLAEES
jgi:hypothetical protein